VSIGDAWEQHAPNWIAWARTSSHDLFATGTWPELRAVLPAPTADDLVLEIGCGEGRVGRELERLGHRVVGIELSATLARAAKEAEPSFAIARADAAALPIIDAAVTVVVACMALQDIDDLEAAVCEAARVLRPGGQLCVAIVHPFASAQDLATLDEEQATVSEPYLRARRYEDPVVRDGLAMTFVSMHRPLSAYMSAFSDAGFLLTALREFGRRAIPWLLVARLEKQS